MKVAVSSIVFTMFFVLLVPISAQANHRSPADFAGPFSALYFFGDSLSDTGNFATQIDPEQLAGASPGQDSSFYWQKRFSNGPNWADQMAKSLGRSATASLLGGTNYARGGSHNVRPFPNPAPGFEVFFEPGLLLSEQIGEYLSGETPGDPDALHVIWMGSNDVAVGGNLEPALGVAEVVRAIEDLHAAGARQFLVWGLFPFVVPGFEALEAYSLGFNELLSTQLDTLDNSLGGIVITRGSFVEAIGPIIDDPDAFGFLNGHDFLAPTGCTSLGHPFPAVGGDPACQAEGLTDTFFGRPVGDTFLFHDGVHFTTAVQRFWSGHAIAELCKTRIRQHFPGRFGKRIARFLCER